MAVRGAPAVWNTELYLPYICLPASSGFQTRTHQTPCAALFAGDKHYYLLFSEVLINALQSECSVGNGFVTVRVECW